MFEYIGSPQNEADCKAGLIDDICQFC